MNQDARSSWNTTRMDLAIAAGTTIALLLLTVVAREDGSPPVDAGAFVLSGLIGVALLWRRRYRVV